MKIGKGFLFCGMIYTIRNSYLQISVIKTGAELCSIKSLLTGREFIWQASPKVWRSHAPVLFPIIGSLKDGFCLFDGKPYKTPKHGLIRNNPNVELAEKTDTSLTFGLGYSEETLALYPFRFNFRITYSLAGNTITVHHLVKNDDEKTMFFSLGGHPAFKCPINFWESYADYFLEFEHPETQQTWLLDNTGLLNGKTKPILGDSKKLPLSHELFANDALIFKTLKSNMVSLKNHTATNSVTMQLNDFPYLGIWAKPEGDFVCIEPWLGVADSSNTDQNLKTKEGILSLEPNTVFNASYSISINE